MLPKEYPDFVSDVPRRNILIVSGEEGKGKEESEGEKGNKKNKGKKEIDGGSK